MDTPHPRTSLTLVPVWPGREVGGGLDQPWQVSCGLLQ